MNGQQGHEGSAGRDAAGPRRDIGSAGTRGAASGGAARSGGGGTGGGAGSAGGGGGGGAAREPVGEDGVELAPGVRVRGDVVEFAFARSSGPGGQNVNKLATKAELRLRIERLPISPRAKDRLVGLAGSRVTTEGELIITSESERSQSRNKSECLEKLRELLVAAMAVPKVRRKTKPTKGSKERRLTEKKSRGEIKKRRGGGGEE